MKKLFKLLLILLVILPFVFYSCEEIEVVLPDENNSVEVDSTYNYQVTINSDSLQNTSINIDSFISSGSISSLLKEIDVNAYNVFLYDSITFMKWCNMISPNNKFVLDFSESMFFNLETALHETMHNIDVRQRNFNYLFFGNSYDVDLFNSPHISIVSETFPDEFKETKRYKLYIEDSKPLTGNKLNILLEEINSYVTGGWFYTQALYKSDKGLFGTVNGGLSGSFDFMLYLECYLKTCRLNYPDNYNLIKTNKAAIEYIQVLIDKMEELMILSSEFNKQGRFRYDQNIFNIAFSDEYLNELDLIGIKHKPSNYWKEIKLY